MPRLQGAYVCLGVQPVASCVGCISGSQSRCNTRPDMTIPDEGADCFFEIFFDADGARLRRVFMTSVAPKFRSRGLRVYDEEAPGGLKGARQTVEGDGVIITRGPGRFPESVSAALRCAGYDVLHIIEERDRDCAGCESSDLIIRVAGFVH